MKEAAVSKRLREEFILNGAVAWKISDRFHASRPDLLIIKSIVTIYLEVKVHPNKITKLQEHTLEELWNSGAPTYTATYYPASKSLIYNNLDGTCSMPFFNLKEAALWLLKQNS